MFLLTETRGIDMAKKPSGKAAIESETGILAEIVGIEVEEGAEPYSDDVPQIAETETEVESAQEPTEGELQQLWEQEAEGDEKSAEAEAKRLEEQRLQRVIAISSMVQEYINEAVQARESSGVEQRWREDMAYYYGNPELANQGLDVARLALAQSSAQAESTERQTRSRINVNITRPKTNAAFARLSDMLFPVDDRNFAIEPTPVPSLAPDQSPQNLVSGPGGQVMPADQVALKKTAMAKAAAELMQTEIDDNLVECDYNSEGRRMLFEAAMLGTGAVCGPNAAASKAFSWRKSAEGEWQKHCIEAIKPASRYVPLWNCYPDPAAGGHVPSMRYFVEADSMTSRDLRGLIGQPGYIDSSIRECLAERAGSLRRDRSERRIVEGSYQELPNQTYPIALVTCELSKGQVIDLAGDGACVCASDEERAEPVMATVMMCNGRAIKAFVNPTQTDLGYDLFHYEPVHGQPFGVGVPFLMRSPQKVVSAAWRMVMDNAAFTVGGQIVMDSRSVVPADGSNALYGGKLWHKIDDDARAVEDVFRVYNMDMHLGELEKIIALGMKFAEDETSLPSLLEGNRGAAPDTVGGMTLLMNSANVILKIMAKRFDDSVTKPHISRYYEWHMRHNPRDELKGDFQVRARGSSHLVIRDLERQSLVGFMQYAVNPMLARFFKDGGYHALRKVAEANHIDPDSVLVTKEEAVAMIQQQMQAAAQGQQSPDAVKLQIEQLRIADLKEQRQHEAQMRQMELEVAMMKLAADKEMTVEQVKAALAGKVMDNAAKKELQTNEAAIKAQMGSGL